MYLFDLHLYQLRQLSTKYFVEGFVSRSIYASICECLIRFIKVFWQIYWVLIFLFTFCSSLISLFTGFPSSEGLLQGFLFSNLHFGYFLFSFLKLGFIHCIVNITLVLGPPSIIYQYRLINLLFICCFHPKNIHFQPLKFMFFPFFKVQIFL